MSYQHFKCLITTGNSKIIIETKGEKSLKAEKFTLNKYTDLPYLLNFNQLILVRTVTFTHFPHLQFSQKKSIS